MAQGFWLSGSGVVVKDAILKVAMWLSAYIGGGVCFDLFGKGNRVSAYVVLSVACLLFFIVDSFRD